MKCKDVSQLLDESELAALSAASAVALEAHVARCAECASQYLASQRLKTFRREVPPLPAALQELAQRLHAACESAVKRRATRRPLIIGSLLLLGTGGTMLASVPWQNARATNLLANGS